MSDFWKNWLNIWGWGVILFGIGLAGFAFEPTAGFTRWFFTLIGQPIADDPGQHMRFAMGLMGCITIGWGFTLLAAFKAAHQLEAANAVGVWRLILAAGLIWYVTDSILSITTGFPLNAVSNTVLIALLLIPLLSSGVL